MKTSVRRGLFHPNDIKTAGLTPVSPSAKSAPLPDMLSAIGHSRTQSHPLNLVTPLAASPFTGPAGTRSHSRSPSFAGSSGGSFGRSDVRRLASQEFNKYAEDDDEDYDDVFGKPNGSCACSFFILFYILVCHAIGWANYRMRTVVLEHPVQTLQLNTRLSNLETKILMRRIRSLRYVHVLCNVLLLLSTICHHRSMRAMRRMT
jgi:hypothetical protein